MGACEYLLRFCIALVALSSFSSALVVCLVLSVGRRQLSDFAPFPLATPFASTCRAIWSHLCNLRAAKVGKLSEATRCLPNEI